MRDVPILMNGGSLPRVSASAHVVCDSLVGRRPATEYLFEITSGGEFCQILARYNQTASDPSALTANQAERSLRTFGQIVNAHA